MAEVESLTASPSPKGVLRHLWPWVRPERRRIAGAVSVSLAQSAAVVAVAPLIGVVTDAVIADDRQQVLQAAVALLVITLIQVGLTKMAQYRLAVTGERVVRRLRDAVVESLGRAPLRWLESTRPGELMQRTTSEIADLATFVRSDLPEALAVGGMSVFTLAVLVWYSPALAAVALVILVPGTALILHWFLHGSTEVFAALAQAEANTAGEFAEIATGREQLMARGTTSARLARFDAANTAAVDATRRAVRVENRIEFTTLVEGLTLAAVLGAGLLAADQGWITVGTVVVFVLGSRSLFETTVQLSQILGSVQSARINGARLADLLQRSGAGSPFAAASPGTASPRTGSLGTASPALAASNLSASNLSASNIAPTQTLAASGGLHLHDVKFEYHSGQTVLDLSDLDFPAGSRTAVVGRTGSGKTTLIKVLAGLYQPDTGRVRFAGTDLGDANPDELRRRIVLIPQRVHLIDGTVEDNIALLPGERPDVARINEIVDRLGLRAWVNGLPDGLASPVGRAGHLLSAGERQIVGLIRAALVDPAVLVLDEASADIDPETAAQIEVALSSLHPDQTLIVIAHRPSTVAALPRLVRLDGGRVVEDSAAGASGAE